MSFVTRDEVIQAAIDAVPHEKRRSVYQEIFDDNKESTFAGFAWRGNAGSSSFAKLMRSPDRVEVTPEQLKRWIAIAKVLLPIILSFL